jgi:hypothetical protein
VALVIVVLALSITAQPPQLAPSFKASIRGVAMNIRGESLVGSPSPFEVAHEGDFVVSGQILYDTRQNRSSVATHAQSVSPNTTVVRQLHQQVDGLRSSWFNGVCSVPPSPSVYRALWSHFQLTGIELHNGQRLQVYSDALTNSTLYVDASTHLPTRLVKHALFHSPPISGVHIEYEVFGGSIYDLAINASVVDSWNDKAFAIPSVCLQSSGLVCNSTQSTVANVTMVRLHSASYGLANHNTANLVGELQYLCKSKELSPTSKSLISVWIVSVNTSYSQYTFCNFGQCAGWTSRHVGRRANLPVWQFGQCSSADLSNDGVWYSLDASGQCSSSQNVGGDVCYWKQAQRVKTISMQCAVTTTKLSQACAAGLVAGGSWGKYSAAAVALQAALQSCPDLPPPNTVAINNQW